PRAPRACRRIRRRRERAVSPCRLAALAAGPRARELPGVRRPRARSRRAAGGGVEVALPRRPLADVVQGEQQGRLRGRSVAAAGTRLARRVAHARRDDPRDGQCLRAAARARLGRRRDRRARLPRVAPRADPRGTLVLTEETERGPLPWWLRWYLRGALHRAHQEWLESLEKVARNGPPKP